MHRIELIRTIASLMKMTESMKTAAAEQTSLSLFALKTYSFCSYTDSFRTNSVTKKRFNKKTVTNSLIIIKAAI